MHLTVRMAWHDNNWNGKVCCDPENNNYCVGARSLLSGRIEKQKDVALEASIGIKDQYVDDISETSYVPPCYWSINAFSDKPFNVNHKHAFNWVEHKIPDVVKPHSVFTWPFKLSFVHTQDNKNIHGNYWPDLEQRISDFTQKFTKNQSIIFFYANYDNPVSADDMKFLLLGCSVIDEVIKPSHFPFTEEELNRMGKGNAGSYMKNFPTLNWSIQFTHQNEKSVLLPYKQYLEHVNNYPEEYGKLDDIKVLIDESSLVRSFKYVAMDIDDDKCLYLLYKIRKSIYKIREHNRQVIQSDLHEEEKRLDGMIEMVWNRRGIYPSLDKVLKYFLDKDCKELANAITAVTSKDFDLQQLFEAVSQDDFPVGLEDFEDDLDDLITNPEFRRNFKSFIKLSLFNLTEHQIKRIIKTYYNQIISGLESNPYLIYEHYVAEPPADEMDKPDLIDEPINVYKLDVGLIPDSRFVKRHRKIQNIRESSPERLRSIMIEYLWSLEGAGHTYDNLRNIVTQLKEHPLIYKTEAHIDENGILAMENEYRNHFQERLHISENGSEIYISLKELYRAEQRIKEKILQLIARPSHTDTSPDYKTHIENSLSTLKGKIAGFDEDLFNTEREKLYQNIFSKSFFLLTGKPGSGKTFETSQVIKHLKLLNQGLEILAPTGKAALRISENIKNNTDLEIKANTIDRYIYENNFWWAYDDWDRLENLPENEKLTVVNLIIDESSMLDLQKLYILFSIIKFNDEYPKRLIFVGDENQLPPIGFGKPFYDIINYTVADENLFNNHYIHLSSNCRQENDLNIIKLAEAFSDKTRYYEESLNLLFKHGKISDGLDISYWKTQKELHSMLKSKISELMISELEKELENSDRLIDNAKSDASKQYLEGRKEQLATQLAANNKESLFNLFHGLYQNGFVPNIEYEFRKILNLENLQVLSPYRPDFYGILGLNKLIQREFKNTDNVDFDSSYYHSEKLIRISNYYQGYGRSKKLILSNGSIGIQVNGSEGIKYYFKDADRVLKWIDDEEQFDLAYAISVHKSQGSDFNNVFLVIPNKLALLNKELIYTALTRSRQRLFLFIYDEKENLLVKSKNISALLTRQSSIFEKPEDKRLKYFPRKGEKPVRSKGEYIIHMALQRSGLAFEYEQELQLENLSFSIHPDFVVKLEDGTTIYWEHLGMLDTRKYYNDWIKRKNDYTNHGLFDFVVTTDDMEGIKDEYVDQLISDIRNKTLRHTAGNIFSNHHYQLY